MTLMTTTTKMTATTITVIEKMLTSDNNNFDCKDVDDFDKNGYIDVMKSLMAMKVMVVTKLTLMITMS